MDWKGIWLLGAPQACDHALLELEKRASRGPSVPVEPVQIWWKGQLVGQCLSVSSVEKDVLDALGTHANQLTGVSVVSFSRRSISDTLSQVEVHDPELSIHQSFQWKSSNVEFDASRIYNRFLEAGGIERRLASSSRFPFEEQVSDLVSFEAALQAQEWTPAAIEAWWRCSENWLRQGIVLGSFGIPDLGFSTQTLGTVESILGLLAKHAPSDLDEDRILTLTRCSVTSKQGIWRCEEPWPNAQFFSEVDFECLRWTRGLLGDERAWEEVRMAVGFLNKSQESAVAWFSKISPTLQYRALNRAWEEHQKVLNYGITIETRGVNRATAALFKESSGWPHWEGVIAELSLSNRVPQDVLDLHQLFQAQQREDAMDLALPAPVVKPPKMRF
jgi:hypothetical protein